MAAAELKQLFSAPEHQPFLWERGSAAALLVHGYTGTPGEVRPLGWSLRQTGWTVQGLLLPGMGSDIESLYEQCYEDWVKAVVSALSALKTRYDPVLLAGYSLGGALAQLAAYEEAPSGLVLLAPFSQFGRSRTVQVLWPVIRRLMPRVHPFSKVDMSDPRVRKALQRYAPGDDVAALDVQERVRRLSIPTRSFDQLWRLARATRGIEYVCAFPTLVVQGRFDPYVRPSDTRAILARLPGPLRYREVSANHTLMGPRCPVWSEVERTVLEFAGCLLARAEDKEAPEAAKEEHSSSPAD
jgi:carboxylesterase